MGAIERGHVLLKAALVGFYEGFCGSYLIL